MIEEPTLFPPTPKNTNLLFRFLDWFRYKMRRSKSGKKNPILVLLHIFYVRTFFTCTFYWLAIGRFFGEKYGMPIMSAVPTVHVILQSLFRNCSLNCIRVTNMSTLEEIRYILLISASLLYVASKSSKNLTGQDPKTSANFHDFWPLPP